MKESLFLVILGKQGSGKGTQCVRLSRSYGLPHISTGDMLRVATRSASPLGLKIKEVVDRGDLVPDELMLELLKERLERDNAREKGFILDGYPRTVAQAISLEELLLPNSIDLVINLDVPTNVVIKRITSRLVCSDCQTVYSTYAPPKVDMLCDICGGEVVQREDDTKEAIERRLSIYETETAPLIVYYAERNLLHNVNGRGSPETVNLRIKRIINKYLESKGVSLD